MKASRIAFAIAALATIFGAGTGGVAFVGILLQQAPAPTFRLFMIAPLMLAALALAGLTLTYGYLAWKP